MSRVRLVGVGPGHPGLATVQAVEAIKDADVIRNADGCGTGLLHLAPGNADIAPLESVDEVIRLARSGRKVTVLFPGNPYAFSNGSQVADRLERAGIDFEAVPGISALLQNGRPPETPAALILNPGQPGQHRVSAPLSELARKAATYGLRGDALLVLGPGVALSDRLDTMSKRPLHGRRVLITRARHQVDTFRRELVDLGASVVEIPTIQIESMP